MGRPSIWVDKPFTLRHTPNFDTEEGDRDQYTNSASEMAVLHNSFSRGLNSIFLQAPYIKEKDVQDFVKYCLVWHNVVSTHHEQEEKFFFPAIEKAGGTAGKGLMEENVKDHNAFHDGLECFNELLLDIQSHKTPYSPSSFTKTIEHFAYVLSKHLDNEIPRLVGRVDHQPSIPLAEIMVQAHREDASIDPSKMMNLLLFVLLNHDVTFEEPLWGNFPPIPPELKRTLLGMMEGESKGVWKFTSW